VRPQARFAGGDNYNDLSMLHPSVARYLCCPSNSIPAVKEQVRAHGGFVADQPGPRGMVAGLQHFFPDWELREPLSA
jgi:hypothetical protein